jgi:RNA polymerase sigma-70 factor (ECF subfamily)
MTRWKDYLLRMTPSEQSRYEALLREYLPPLRRLAWSYTLDATEGDDLLQEIALALWSGLPRFRGDSSERTWVYRVAHNTGISYATSQKRRTARERAASPHMEPTSSSNPEGEAIGREQWHRLWNAIRDLPLADRQLICLHLEGLSALQIEEITGVSAGNVATRLTRIRQRLVARLRGEEVRP